jgi:hypothetical protein
MKDNLSRRANHQKSKGWFAFNSQSRRQMDGTPVWVRVHPRKEKGLGLKGCVLAAADFVVDGGFSLFLAPLVSATACNSICLL